MAAHPSCEDEKDWQSEYTRLSQKYTALSENFKKAKEALHKRRHERDQWIQHARLLERKIQEAEREHEIRILDQNIENPRISPQQNGEEEQRLARGSVSTPEPRVVPTGPDSSAPTTDAPAASAKSAGSRTASDSSRKSEEPTLPALPDPNQATTVKIKEEPSSGRAIFVEERSLRKRKFNDHDEDEPNQRRVKTEPSDHSSSPLVARQGFDFPASDSIDLGDQVPAISTPRRYQEREFPVNHGNRPICADSTTTRPIPEAITAHSYAHSSGLTPVSLNSQPPQKQTPTYSLGKPIKKGLGRGIAVLAEDGALYDKPAHDSPSTSKAKPSAAKNRLNALLNTTYVEDDGKINRPSPRGRQTPTNTHGGLAMPKPRDLPFDRNGRPIIERPEASVSTTPRPPLADATNTAHSKAKSAHGKKTRGLLRNKPISELKLDDFKINPSLNDGHDYAFSEVVRDKDGRACLAGCVDMHCCGKEFRALALSQRPNPPLTPEQRQEEQRLLEEYLGDYCYRLATMSKEERAEVWVEAKMRELANKYGRHRHRFSRMRSPPGFWNADFPSTQELETNRVEAAKRERQTIQERYREAMRSDGRWLFRDE